MGGREVRRRGKCARAGSVCPGAQEGFEAERGFVCARRPISPPEVSAEKPTSSLNMEPSAWEQRERCE